MFLRLFWSIKETPQIFFKKQTEDDNIKVHTPESNCAYHWSICQMFQVAQSERTSAKRNLSSCKSMLSCHSLPNAQWASEEPLLQTLHSFKVLTSDQRSLVKDQAKR